MSKQQWGHGFFAGMRAARREGKDLKNGFRCVLRVDCRRDQEKLDRLQRIAQQLPYADQIERIFWDNKNGWGPYIYFNCMYADIPCSAFSIFRPDGHFMDFSVITIEGKDGESDDLWCMMETEKKQKINWIHLVRNLPAYLSLLSFRRRVKRYNGEGRENILKDIEMVISNIKFGPDHQTARTAGAIDRLTL